jgi:hypothetical protein
LKEYNVYSRLETNWLIDGMKRRHYGKNPDGNKASLVENFDKFKADGECVWVDVIHTYMNEEEKGIGKLISKLDDPNTINAWADITKQREMEDSE